eukprot:9403165-Heterocapsa_arctica.AAC.1
MEEVAKMTQRRMRELEITVKLQYAQMDRMEKAALAEMQMRAREAATAMRGARTVEGMTANRTMEQMDAMVLAMQQKTRALEAVIKTQDEQLDNMETVVVETQQKLRRMEDTV